LEETFYRIADCYVYFFRNTMIETQRHRGHRVVVENNQLTQAIIGAAIEVHKRLGPGLLESAYRVCLTHEPSWLISQQSNRGRVES